MGRVEIERSSWTGSRRGRLVPTPPTASGSNRKKDADRRRATYSKLGWDIEALKAQGARLR